MQESKGRVVGSWIIAAISMVTAIIVATSLSDWSKLGVDG